MLLRGYRQHAALDPAHEHALPLVQRLAAALIYARLARALQHTPTREPEPDWLVALRARLTRTAERLQAALTATPT